MLHRLNYHQRVDEWHIYTTLVAPWCMVITTEQLHSTKFELRFCAFSNHVVLEVCDEQSLTMVLPGNKAKRLSSVNHTTKNIPHRHQSPLKYLTTAGF